jgi:hypothetical protein
LLLEILVDKEGPYPRRFGKSYRAYTAAKVIAELPALAKEGILPINQIPINPGSDP